MKNNLKYISQLLLKKYLRRKKRILLGKRKINISKRASKLGNKSKILEDIRIPSDLSFTENWESVVETLNNIDYSLRYRFVDLKKSLSIDHSKMKSVSSAGILVLASTIECSQKIANVKFVGKEEFLPKNDVIRYLLNEIDYWKYFDVSKLSTEITQKRFSFFKIIDSYEADNTKIGKMIEFFSKKVGFNGETRAHLYTALSEAAANTIEHGYSNTSIKKDKINNRWWLTANIDAKEQVISFVFYDQGIGIFKSLESNKKDFLRNFFKKTKALVKTNPHAKILQRMLHENFSRHNTENRGYGLQTFKKFIDESEEGSLFIASDNASYLYPSDTLQEYTHKLKGTLIVWKIKVGYDKSKNIYLKEEQKDEEI